MKKKIFVYSLFILVFLTYTSLAVKWQFSPYLLIKNLKQNLKLTFSPSFINTDELTLGPDNSLNKNIGSIINLNNPKLTKSITLNSFKFEFDKIDVKGLGKIGAAELSGKNIWFINQDDYQLIKQLNLEKMINFNGGIKSIFSLGSKNFVYVTYIKDSCASARLIDLNSMKVAIQFSCLPNPDNADLNGAGGGWLKLSDNEGLLAIGTPTSGNVNDGINLLAQSHQSLWGKILKLSIVNDKLMVEIFSHGHRNPQGIARIGKDIFAVEHGPMGGDEINIIKKNLNYGWPLQSLGSQYDLGSINKSYDKPVMTEPPLLSFVPSIGLSYIDKCPQSYHDYYLPNQCVAVSSMRGESIDFIVHKNNKVLFSEKMKFESRIRKFFVRGNTIVAVTDFEGIIIGNLTKLN